MELHTQSCPGQAGSQVPHEYHPVSLICPWCGESENAVAVRLKARVMAVTEKVAALEAAEKVSPETMRFTATIRRGCG